MMRCESSWLIWRSNSQTYSLWITLTRRQEFHTWLTVTMKMRSNVCLTLLQSLIRRQALMRKFKSLSQVRWRETSAWALKSPTTWSSIWFQTFTRMSLLVIFCKRGKSWLYPCQTPGVLKIKSLTKSRNRLLTRLYLLDLTPSVIFLTTLVHNLAFKLWLRKPCTVSLQTIYSWQP